MKLIPQKIKRKTLLAHKNVAPSWLLVQILVCCTCHTGNKGGKTPFDLQAKRVANGYGHIFEYTIIFKSKWVMPLLSQL